MCLNSHSFPSSLPYFQPELREIIYIYQVYRLGVEQLTSRLAIDLSVYNLFPTAISILYLHIQYTHIYVYWYFWSHQRNATMSNRFNRNSSNISSAINCFLTVLYEYFSLIPQAKQQFPKLAYNAIWSAISRDSRRRKIMVSESAFIAFGATGTIGDHIG